MIIPLIHLMMKTIIEAEEEDVEMMEEEVEEKILIEIMIKIFL